MAPLAARWYGGEAGEYEPGSLCRFGGGPDMGGEGATSIEKDLSVLLTAEEMKVRGYERPSWRPPCGLTGDALCSYAASSYPRASLESRQSTVGAERVFRVVRWDR